MVHQLRSDDPDEHFQILKIARKHFSLGGARRVRHTLPPLAFSALQVWSNHSTQLPVAIEHDIVAPTQYPNPPRPTPYRPPTCLYHRSQSRVPTSPSHCPLTPLTPFPLPCSSHSQCSAPTSPTNSPSFSMSPPTPLTNLLTPLMNPPLSLLCCHICTGKAVSSAVLLRKSFGCARPNSFCAGPSFAAGST